MTSSDSGAPEQLFSLLEDFLSNRDFVPFLPFLFVSAEPSAAESTTPIEETSTAGSDLRSRRRIILVNPFTRGMIVIEGGESTLNSILQDLTNSKGGDPPASKASIDALQEAEVLAGEEVDGECVICLENWEIGGKLKLMPCSHKFHPSCIEKWLGMHGSCPVCRHKMPVEDEGPGSNTSNIRVTFSSGPQRPNNED